jgi:hypothetical protein
MRLSVILLLLVAAPRAGAAATRAEADRAWPSFYASFRDAVRRRDREALRRMMPAEFDYSDGGGDEDGDGDARDEAFGRLLRGGAVPGEGRLGSHNGTPQRVAPPAINQRVNVVRGRIAWYAVFEFREDRRWYCIVFKECCD